MLTYTMWYLMHLYYRSECYADVYHAIPHPSVLSKWVLCWHIPCDTSCICIIEVSAMLTYIMWYLIRLYLIRLSIKSTSLLHVVMLVLWASDDRNCLLWLTCSYYLCVVSSVFVGDLTSTSDFICCVYMLIHADTGWQFSYMELLHTQESWRLIQCCRWKLCMVGIMQSALSACNGSHLFLYFGFSFHF